MSERIVIGVDSGHGANTSGKRTAPFSKDVDIDGDGKIDVRKGEQYREHFINTSVCHYLDIALRRNDFDVVKSAWDDENGRDDFNDISLGARQGIIKSNRCHASISVHANAYGNGSTYNSANGSESYHHSNPASVKDSKKLATYVQSELIKGTKQKNRGVKGGNYALCNANAMGTRASILVELAFMTNQPEAETMLANEEYYIESAEEICAGFCRYFSRGYIPRIDDPNDVTKPEVTNGWDPIISKSECTAEQMANYLVRYNPEAKSWALDYAKLYLEEGEEEGVRGDAAWIQSCKETHYFIFDMGTAVTFDQNNFCGMGVTSKGMKGNSFDTPQIGIRAQIQHLKGYASPLPLGNPCVDPRYKYISPKGKAPTFQELAGKWAVPGYSTTQASSLSEAMSKGVGYGFDIMKGVDKMKLESKVLNYKIPTITIPDDKLPPGVLLVPCDGILDVIYKGKDGIEVHYTPDFKAESCNKKNGPVGPSTTKGSKFTVVGRTNNGMYKLKSGLYITASTKYVKFTPK